jgi:predicted transcriptional regulator of viral defense system
MTYAKRTTALPSYLNGLLSAGKVVFTRDEAQKAIGSSVGAFLDAAERQQRKHHLISPRQGFYIVVPPQYLAWGGPPPTWYIDDLMRHEGSPYYVGLLKAAELHGATHQAVMEFQVVTNKRLPQLRIGRSNIAFYYRKDFDPIAAGIAERKTDTGYMKVSSPELTALDLLRYPHAGGGLDNIVTVMADMAERLDAGKLAALAGAYERSVSQRLGYLLDHVGRSDRADALHRLLTKKSTVPWVELEPSLAKEMELAPEPQDRNERWHIIVRRLPEKDE